MSKREVEKIGIECSIMKYGDEIKVRNAQLIIEKPNEQL